MNDILDNHLVFQFKFINKTKKVNDNFIDKLKNISNHTIRELKLLPKEQAGYATIETNKTKLPKKLNNNFIEHINTIHNTKIEEIIVKYEYLRVGKKERIYGKVFDSIFYILLYDPDKKYQ